MTFWTQPDLSPTRQFRFKISDDIETWYHVSSCSKPSYEISTEEYKIINYKFKYPGVVTWNDVNITIVDTGNRANELFNALGQSGYNLNRIATYDGLSKIEAASRLGNFTIQQLDDEGVALETWTLKNAFIKSVNFGQLDYSSDELVKLELVISYDYATFSNQQVADANIINL